ncbi:MAG: hypothetical protein U9Q30_10525 [Campylobacterota bacterium]|nr:hypothetical protein [Campylobacterota bacterium]
MKKIKYSIVCCAILSSVNINAIDLEKGWNLISLPSDTNISDISNQNIKSIWAYDDNWKAYSFDESYNNLIKNENIEELTTINSSQGIWIQALDEVSISNLSEKIDNEIDIKKGWNLIGTIEDISNIKEIDPNAIYWKYSDGSWKLGDNKEYSGIESFSDISKDEGLWVYSASSYIHKEDKQKKFLFLDENLIPQRVSFDSKNSTIDGYIHSDYKKSLFDFNNSGFIPFSAGYENGELVSEYVSDSDENYAIFLEDNTNQVTFENNGTDSMKLPLLLPDYNLNFEEIIDIYIAAAPIKPLLMSANVIMILSNVDMKQSLTLSFEDIKDKPEDFPNIGVFKLGVSTTVQGTDTKVIEPTTIDGQMNLKPIFKNVGEVTNPYIYALNGDTWELVGEGYISKSGSVVSKNWYNKFTSFALVDVDSSSVYNTTNIIKNEQGQVLRDVLVVSDNKIVVTTNKDGNFTYSSPSKPSRLVAYKKGYQPQVLDSSLDKNIILKPLQSIALVDGVDGKYDKDFNTIYTIGDKNKEFTYLGTDYNIKPQLLANTDYIIYSTVYPYNDGYVFGASNSIISTIDKDGNLSKIDEANGIIYDGLVVDNSTIYYGTFSDTFVDLTNKNIDEELSGFGLSVVYKPILSNEKLYIPLYNQDNNQTNATLFIKGVDNIETSNIKLIDDLGTSGKLSQTSDEVIFGTNYSKIIFLDKESNSISKTIDFGGVGIIAEILTLDNSYFAIDLDGVLKKYDSSKEFVDSIALTPSSNIFVADDEVIVADNNGTIYKLDSDLNINSVYDLEDKIIAKPIVYGSDIYIITNSGKFYKNDNLIGTFNTKVSNMNLVNNMILFGGENGTVWKIEL